MAKDIDIMEYKLDCPECPYKKEFSEMWGYTPKWIEHVINEHNYTPEDIKRVFPLWEESINDLLDQQAYDYATSEGDMTDRAYEEWKERSL